MILAIISAALPLSAADPTLECFATTAEAVDAAAHAALALSTQYEVGGAIYRHGPLACFTRPVTQGTTTEIDYRVGLVPPDTLLALFHTHPDNYGISESDKALSRKMGVPMYVVSVPRHEVLAYHAKGFVLDVVPVEFETITLNGVVYRLKSRDPWGNLLVELNGHVYYVPGKSSGEAVK